MPSFFFNYTATPEIYTLSLHDALPISSTIVSPTTCTRTPERLRAVFRRSPKSIRWEEHTSELQSRLHLVCRLFFLITRPPPRSTLFPYTTLFRSRRRSCRQRRVPGPRRGSAPSSEGRRSRLDGKSTRLNSSHGYISYAVFFF